MADVRTVSDPEAVTTDWLLAEGGLLAAGRELESAVVISLLTDRLAGPDDRLPGFDDDDRRGWWADHEATEIWGAPPIGSRLWLVSREKTRDETRERVEAYCREALAWITEQRIGTRVDVASEWLDEGTLAVDIVIWRGAERLVALRFQSLWDIYKG